MYASQARLRRAFSLHVHPVNESRANPARVCEQRSPLPIVKAKPTERQNTPAIGRMTHHAEGPMIYQLMMWSIVTSTVKKRPA
jgi:hypothetical protein